MASHSVTNLNSDLPGLPGLVSDSSTDGLTWLAIPGAAGGDPAGGTPAAGPAVDSASAPSLLLGQDSVAGNTSAAGAADSAAVLLSYLNSAKPVGISFFPDGAGSTVGDSALTFVAPPAMDLVAASASAGDLGGDGGQSASGDVSLFSKGSSSGGSGGSGSTGNPLTVLYSSPNSALKFNITYDGSVTGASNASQIEGAIQTAINYFLNNFNSPITINMNVGWGEVAGQKLSAFALGESTFSLDPFTYSAVSGAMQAQATNNPYFPGTTTTTPEAQAAGTLPGADPLPDAQYLLTSASARALGLPDANTWDGAVGFAKSSRLVPWSFTGTANSGQYDFVGTAKHEISEVLGRLSWLGMSVSDNGIIYQSSYSNLDLFRYSSFDGTNGSRATTSGGTAYFSYDNGKTNQSYFNTNPNNGDVGDWSGTSQANDAYNYAASLGTLQTTAADANELNVLGYLRQSANIV